MARALINVPPKARRGEIVDIKTLVQHPMETGYRPNNSGGMYPREIIRRFVCTLDGEEVFSMDLFPAVAANPFIAFTLLAEKSGTLTFSWTDDHGKTQTETAALVVE